MSFRQLSVPVVHLVMYVRRLREDVEEMEATVRRHESTKRHEADLALCRLCFVSRFADGVGRMCCECKRRVCPNCGSMCQSPDDKKVW